MKKARRGVYRGTYSALIDDPDYQRLSARARLALLTMRLSREAGVACIFRLYVAVLAEQTGLRIDEVEAALKELASSPNAARPWIYREGSIVWIRNGLRYDPNVRLGDERHRKGVERAVEALPRLEIVAKFCDYYEIAKPFDESPGLEGDFAPPISDIRVPISETEYEDRVRPFSPNGHGPAHVVRIDGIREVDL
jgi:hypothetical protein